MRLCALCNVGFDMNLGKISANWSGKIKGQVSGFELQNPTVSTPRITRKAFLQREN